MSALTWLLAFMAGAIRGFARRLGYKPAKRGRLGRRIPALPWTVEADEMWSFVTKKSNKQWIWIALDAKTRQILAFHVGDRSRESARQLWGKNNRRFTGNTLPFIPIFMILMWMSSQKNKHVRVPRTPVYTNHIERFNCTMRQRVSRLVRDSLAFSKKLDNHIGAIRYFICHYNQTRNPAALLCSTTEFFKSTSHQRRLINSPFRAPVVIAINHQ